MEKRWVTAEKDVIEVMSTPKGAPLEPPMASQRKPQDCLLR